MWANRISGRWLRALSAAPWRPLPRLGGSAGAIWVWLNGLAVLAGMALLAWAGAMVTPALGLAVGGLGLFLAGGGLGLFWPGRGRH